MAPNQPTPNRAETPSPISPDPTPGDSLGGQGRGGQSRGGQSRGGQGRPRPLGGLMPQAGLWPLRVAWVASALVVGRPLTQAASQLERPGPILIEVCLWAAWFVGTVAVLVPSPISLTTIRVLAPGASAVVMVALVAVESRNYDLGAALAASVVVAGLALQPTVGDRMVNGSAYGSERRMTLRPPAFALLGPIQVAWLLVVTGLITPPLLLARGQWALGAVLGVVGLGAVWLGGRVLHQLARRWLVFVPAGFVIHDPTVLIESILVGRTNLEAIGPATLPLEDGATDLGRGARGLALAAHTKDPVEFALRQPGIVESTMSRVLVFNPTLPGAVLTEGRTRAIPIGLK